MNKFSAEKAIQQRREHRAQLERANANAAAFYNRGTIGAKQNQKWDSDAVFVKSMSAWGSRDVAEEKKRKLAARKSKLKELLSKEKDEWTRELKAMVPTKYDKYERMKSRTTQLKTARESRRDQDAREKKLQSIRESHPDIRRRSQEQQRDRVQTVRAQQVEDTIRAKAYEDERERALELLEEKTAAKRAKEVKAREEKSRLDALDVAKERRRQMEVLAERDKEAQRLRDEQKRVEMELAQLQIEDDNRKAQTRRLKQIRYGDQLQRQHQLALKRQSQIVQESLEYDLRLLEDLAEAERDEKELLTRRRETAREDVDWMRQEVERQLYEERQRELYFDEMYRDEARRVIAKQEAVWDRERHAREKLMKQVLAERALQLADKKAKVRQKQEESVETRRKLLADLEAMGQETRRTQENGARKVQTRREELDEQLQEKSRREREAAVAEILAERRRRAEEEDLRDDVELVTHRMRSEGTRRGEQVYSPPRFGRVRVAWN